MEGDGKLLIEELGFTYTGNFVSNKIKGKGTVDF
jgi:hypothetical protein